MTLLEQNHERILRICRFYERDRGLQEDLYQEICFQAWRSFKSFEGKAQASTWLYRVAVNTALGHVRKNSKRKTEGLAESHYQVAQAPAVERQLEQEEQMRALHRAIAHLGKLDQTLILLYLEELDYKEMAEVTGLTVSNVGVRLNRIRKKLSQKITT
jgi:RNA polymerase sigma factor (sigma-70 family)